MVGGVEMCSVQPLVFGLNLTLGEMVALDCNVFSVISWLVVMVWRRW